MWFWITQICLRGEVHVRGGKKLRVGGHLVGEQWDESNLMEWIRLNPMQLASQGLWMIKLLQAWVLFSNQCGTCTMGTLGPAELWVEVIMLNQFAAFLPAHFRTQHMVSHCSSMDLAQKARGASKAKSNVALLSLSSLKHSQLSEIVMTYYLFAMWFSSITCLNKLDLCN